MNETGLAVNVFYHSGVADYLDVNPRRQASSIESLDVCQYVLIICSTIAEVKASMAKLDVVAVTEESIGIQPPIHLICTEPSGKAILHDFTKNSLQIWCTTRLRDQRSDLRLTLSQPASRKDTGKETMDEAIRILDHFNGKQDRAVNSKKSAHRARVIVA